MNIHEERHLAAEIVVSAIVAAIVIALIAVVGPTKDAKAEEVRSGYRVHL